MNPGTIIADLEAKLVMRQARIDELESEVGRILASLREVRETKNRRITELVQTLTQVREELDALRRINLNAGPRLPR